MKDPVVRKATKTGGSVRLALTGFLEKNKFYKVEGDGKKVTITPITV